MRLSNRSVCLTSSFAHRKHQTPIFALYSLMLVNCRTIVALHIQMFEWTSSVFKQRIETVRNITRTFLRLYVTSFIAAPLSIRVQTSKALTVNRLRSEFPSGKLFPLLAFTSPLRVEILSAKVPFVERRVVVCHSGRLLLSIGASIQPSSGSWVTCPIGRFNWWIVLQWVRASSLVIVRCANVLCFHI